MNVIPLLSKLWSGFGWELTTVFGVSVTNGGALLLLCWFALGVVLTGLISHRVIWLMKRQEINDAPLHRFTRVLLGLLVIPLCVIIGLDMGGVASVVNSTDTLFALLDMSLGFTLFTRNDIPVTLGSVLSVGVCLWLGRRLTPRVRRLVHRISEERGVHDERALQLIEQITGALTMLSFLGIGMDFGGLLTFRTSVGLFFAMFTTPMFKISDHAITVTTLLTVMVVIAGSFYISRLARAALRPALQLRLNEDADQGTVSVIDRLVHYVVVAIGVVIALQTAGIDLSALLATGAAFAVGLSLAMQSMAQNFISGLILLLERAIKPGDILELDGEPVRVVRIGIRSTVVKTLNDEDRIVPNASLVENAITNYSYDNQNLRVRAMVGVAYESDLKQTMATLQRAAMRAAQVKSITPRVMLVSFGASSVDFEVSIWIEDPWRLHQAASDLRMAIWDALHEDNIVIAFPQLDVHVDQGLTEALTLLPSPAVESQ